MDLNSGQYTGYGMTNESKKGPILNEGKFTPDQYTADAALGDQALSPGSLQ